MEIINSGTTRLVLVFKKVVIKFPRIKNFWKNLVINFMEFLVFFFYQSDFCMSTYFSLFGIVNVQKRGSKTQYSNQNSRRQISNYEKFVIDFLKNKKVKELDSYKLRHTFSITNMFLDGDKLKNVDYGDWIMIKFIKFYEKNKTLFV